MGWTELEGGGLEDLQHSPEFRARLESMYERDDLTQSSEEEEEEDDGEETTCGLAGENRNKMKKKQMCERPSKRQRTHICSFVVCSCVVMWSHVQSLSLQPTHLHAATIYIF